MADYSGRLIQVTTPQNHSLTGFLSPAEKENRDIVLTIHGKGENFYDFPWIFHSLTAANQAGWDFLTVNNSGHDSNYRNELLEQSIPDIQTWIDFAIHHQYRRIILLGHSLGCHKAAIYASQVQPACITGLVLLAPTDSIKNWLDHCNGQQEKFLQQAQHMINSGHGDDTVSHDMYFKPISAYNYISFFNDHSLLHIFDFHNPHFDFRTLGSISIPTIAIIGTQDDKLGYQPPTIHLLSHRMPQAQTQIINHADHFFSNHGEELIKHVASFLKNMKA